MPLRSLRIDFESRLSRFPSAGLITVPTPLQPLKRLRAHLEGPHVWIKRDDATHISSGGNKMRKLDRVLYEALNQGCDTLVSGGVAQSNSQRQVATAAAMLGMSCHLAVYQGRVETHSQLYNLSGNVVLNRLFGAVTHHVGWTGDRNSAISELAETLAKDGKKPFVIPYGVSNAMGALSYSSVVSEIASQCDVVGVEPRAIIASTGSGGTQAGLSVGAQVCLPDTQVICFDVDAEPERVCKDAVTYGSQASQLLGTQFESNKVIVHSGFAGPGYGQLAAETVEAMALLARLEGIVLDPVYTGKAMAGLIRWVRDGQFNSSDHVIFIHTGGMPATFAYADKITESL